MSLLGKTCGVRMYKGPCVCKMGCDRCQIGCFRPARYRNPFYNTDFSTDIHWWRGGYNYAEFLCDECYDGMIEDAKAWEETMAGEPGYEENPEYQEILDNL